MADWFILLIICVGTAVLTLRFLYAPPRRVATGPLPDTAPVFLFDGQKLLSSSSAAAPLIKSCGPVAGWDDIRRQLAGSFPGTPDHPDTIRETGPLTLHGIGDDAGNRATFEWIDGITRVRLSLTDRPDPKQVTPENQCTDENLSGSVRAAPYPIWREDVDGAVIWSNKAYDDTRERIHGPKAAPGRSLFPPLAPARIAGSRSRVSIPVPDCAQKLWYDVTTVESGSQRMGYAVDVNAVVDAEIAQRNFVQTLAKTFAQLSIGLAIFDRNSQLALFNPALIDLTSLPADFLSARPTLLNFFDKLRDQRVMPEPKDYNSWRQQITELAEAAAVGQYHETWSLPSGSVYSVSGRPHPDGAVAFLFEDITAEITLTRRFRSELELSQAIIDQMEDAIAVFAADGTMSYSNTAFHDLWGLDPDLGFAPTTIVDACRVWQEKGDPTPVWGRLNDCVHLRSERGDWSETVKLRGGRPLICAVTPIQKGATLVRFSSPIGALSRSADPMPA